jgi:hypothetical protein
VATVSNPEAPPPNREVPKVSFGETDEAETQSEAERELQEENAETSLDQPSQ